MLATAGKAEALQLSRVTDINPGSGSSDPNNLTVFDNALYFSAYDRVNGNKLWKYDGTTASPVADIKPGGIWGFPKKYVTVFNNALYFFSRSSDPLKGTELWKYDGTTANLVTEIFLRRENPFYFGRSSLFPWDFTVFDNALYISAGDSTVPGYELWKYDGTSASLVSNIFRGQAHWLDWPLSSELTVFNNTLYFRANADWGNNTELWKYTGRPTRPGGRPTVTLAADINPGKPLSGRGGSSSPSGLTVFDNGLYFSADDGVHGRELWKYNGTTASLVADIFPGKDLLGRGSSSYPYGLRVFDNALYFNADDGVHGRELWKYDGTTTSLVADLNPGSGSSGPDYLTVFDNALYFSANDGVHGRYLWKYDGTTASLVADINPGSGHSYPTNLTVFDNALYFIAYDGVHDRDLWKYDGTTASLVGDTDPGSRGSFNYYLRVFDNALYVFRSSYEPRNTELWKYDGTTARLVAEIFPSSKNFFLSSVTVFNNALYFSATNGAHGYELWKYDGTTASLVADLNPGSQSSEPGSFTVFNNALYFNANDGVHGYELWKLELDVSTSVPEPASGLGLLTFGAIGAGSMLKRKQKKPLNSVS
jgi:ELWxxDGT repeat protein